jgi:hypothetical protein
MLFFKTYRRRLCLLLVASVVSVWFCDAGSARMGGFYGATIWPSDVYKKNQSTFATPESAVRALVEALSSNDEKKLLAILGPKGKRLVFPGSDVDNRAARERFVQAYQEKNRIIKVSRSKAVLEIGNEDRPFPLPIEKVDGNWRFSAKHGRVELLNPSDRKE